jgi:ADP-ribosyl-[dinitrogen reductase] hydrolase
MSNKDLRSPVLGCVIGGAVGDALGAPFEGLWAHSLPPKSVLMSQFAEYEGFPQGQYTDDTQLTIATLESITKVGRIDPSHIARSIFRLFKNQAVIGPGGACSLAASQFFERNEWDACGAPVGNAGNGTAMRTSALGLLFINQPNNLPEAVANVSRITHHDPRSIAGGVAIAKATQLLVEDPGLDGRTLCQAVGETIKEFHEPFAKYIIGLPDASTGTEKQRLDYISWAGMRYPEFENPIITPFVIPTVLASLWAVISHPTSWEDSVYAAISLGGDVDTLGAIVGAMMGARLGFSSIPNRLVTTVRDAKKVIKLAETYDLVVSRARNVSD